MSTQNTLVLQCSERNNWRCAFVYKWKGFFISNKVAFQELHDVQG